MIPSSFAKMFLQREHLFFQSEFSRLVSHRVPVCGSTRLTSSLRNKLSKHVAFPHPQPRKHHPGKEDKPSCGRVVGQFFKRTVNISKDRNGEHNVNPADDDAL